MVAFLIWISAVLICSTAPFVQVIVNVYVPVVTFATPVVGMPLICPSPSPARIVAVDQVLQGNTEAPDASVAKALQANPAVSRADVVHFMSNSSPLFMERAGGVVLNESSPNGESMRDSPSAPCCATSIYTVAIFESTVPSLALNLNESLPTKLFA